MPAIAITILASAYLFAFLFFFGRKKPGYSHIRHTISELGEIGAPHQRLVAFGGFAPVGMALLLVAYLARSGAHESAMLALCIAIGYLVAALFPCDAGSPVSGSGRQAIHNLGGAIEYIGGAFALFRIAAQFGQSFQIASFVVLGAAFAISMPPFSPVRGLVQRAAELCLFGGLALALWHGLAGAS